MNLFQYESTFSTMVRKLLVCVLLSALWVVSCLPVVTAGAASLSLYDTARRYFLHEEGYPLRDYWSCFRREWKRSTLAWLPLLAAGVLFCWDIWYFMQMLANGDAEGSLFLLVAIMLILLLLTAVYTFAYLSRFQDTPFRAIKNAFLLMLVHPLVNLKIAVLGAVLVLAVLTQPAFLLILPGLFCWLLCRSTEKIFARLIRRGQGSTQDTEAADGEGILSEAAAAEEAELRAAEAAVQRLYAQREVKNRPEGS